MGYVNVPLTYPCKDGGVKFFPFVEEGMLPSTNGMTQWAIEEGFGTEAARKVDWRTWNWQAVSQELVDEITGCFARLFMKHTKAELWEEAQKRGVQLYPVFTAEDMLNFPQLSIRGYWEKVAHPELGADDYLSRRFHPAGGGLVPDTAARPAYRRAQRRNLY